MHILNLACDFLVVSTIPDRCELIFVLAGRHERKCFGLELLGMGLAPRLVLSVGRSEVRQSAELPLAIPQLVAMRDATQPSERHFWIDVTNGNSKISHANLQERGTFGELQALASYLEPHAPASIAIVSTSIHLRRVQSCCTRLGFFA